VANRGGLILSGKIADFYIVCRIESVTTANWGVSFSHHTIISPVYLAQLHDQFCGW
jgi:hypothetical protein